MWPAAHAGRHRFAQLPEHGVPSTRPSRTIADDGVVIAFPLDGSTVPCFAPLRFGDCFLTLPSQLTPQLLSDRCLQGPSRISIIGRCRRPLSASAAAGHEDCPVNVRVLVPTGVPRHLEGQCWRAFCEFRREDVRIGRHASVQRVLGKPIQHAGTLRGTRLSVPQNALLPTVSLGSLSSCTASLACPRPALSDRAFRSAAQLRTATLVRSIPDRSAWDTMPHGIPLPKLYACRHDQLLTDSSALFRLVGVSDAPAAPAGPLHAQSLGDRAGGTGVRDMAASAAGERDGGLRIAGSPTHARRGIRSRSCAPPPRLQLSLYAYACMAVSSQKRCCTTMLGLGRGQRSVRKFVYLVQHDVELSVAHLLSPHSDALLAVSMTPPFLTGCTCQFACLARAAPA